jgi:hypothetical protein
MKANRANHRLHHLDRIALERERTSRHSTPHLAGRRMLVHLHRWRTHQASAEVGFGRAGFNDGKLDVEGRDLLGHCLDEILDAPFGRVVYTKIGIGALAAFG